MGKVSIIENTLEARKEHGFLYGYDEATITREQIQALLDGKALAMEVNDEYVMFIDLESED
jgi:hypothetical protein